VGTLDDGDIMRDMHRQIAPKAKLIAVIFMAALVAACTMPPPPKPAMVPLGQTGDFGYSERDVGQDRIEVTYTGATVPVSSRAGRDDSRVKAEQAKILLWTKLVLRRSLLLPAGAPRLRPGRHHADRAIAQAAGSARFDTAVREGNADPPAIGPRRGGVLKLQL
jgi:hypothetical protein